MKKTKYKIISIGVILLSIMVIIVLSPIFSIKSINIKMVDEIKSEEIFEQLGVSIGDNIFISLITQGNILTFKFKESINKIHTRYKTLKNIDVYAVLPNQIYVEYEIANQVFEIIHEGNYIVIDEEGYVLDVTDNHTISRIRISGLDFNRYTLYEKIDISLKDRENIKTIYMEIQRYDSEYFTAFKEYIDWIEFSKEKTISIMYDNRVLIKINSEDDLSYKIASMCVILSKQIGPNEKGLLDMTKGDKSIFTPK